MAKPLSPAAQAVLNAYRSNWVDEPLRIDVECLAAALRVAVKYTKKQKVLRTFGVPMVKGPVYCLESTLLAIADELEGADG